MKQSEADVAIEDQERAISDEPAEVDWEPGELPKAEVRSYGFQIAVPEGFEASGEAIKIAEFWLNVSDGDALLALVRACERMSQIADKESFGFRRGRSPVMPTGLLKDERLI